MPCWFILTSLWGPTVNKRFFWILLASFCVSFVPCMLFGQPYDPSMFQDLRWRMIGPFRGGRTVAISGIPGQPNVFYMAPNEWRSLEDDRLRPHLESDF